jgi:hypothetical protein
MEEINKYYPSIDKNVLTDLCKNNNLKNLINLSTQTDIPIFTKNKLKKKEKLLKECEKIKKQELKKSSTMLSNLAKLNQLTEMKVENIQTIYKKLEDKITTIDKIIDYVNVLSDESEKYIECYSNC